MTNLLIAALILVESGGNPYAVGRQGELGILQIKPEVVRHVNAAYRLPPELAFRWPEDCLDPEMSRVICSLHLSNVACGKSDEYKARAWNAGKHGANQGHGRIYWRKVRRHLSTNTRCRDVSRRDNRATKGPDNISTLPGNGVNREVRNDP